MHDNKLWGGAAARRPCSLHTGTHQLCRTAAARPVAAQIAQVLKCFTMGDELVRSAALLFTRAADLEESVEAMTSVMQERDIHALQQQLGWYSYCRFSNPTGHYELNLTTHVHQALASRLKVRRLVGRVKGSKLVAARGRLEARADVANNSPLRALLWRRPCRTWRSASPATATTGTTSSTTSTRRPTR